jgi:dipeptidyl aminopeptidase/acylaminoacyl peptidase
MASPLDDLLQIRTVTAAALSSDGTKLGLIDDADGVGQLWVRPWPDGAPTKLSVDFEKAGQVAFAPGSHDLVFTQDVGGDEQHRLYLVTAADGRPRLLPSAPDVHNAWGAWDPSGKQIAYASNARDPQHMDVHVMDVTSREVRMVVAGDGWRQAAAWTPDGKGLLVQDCEPGMFDQELQLVDVATGEARVLLPRAKPKARYLTPKWLKDGSGFFLLTNQGRSFHGLAFFHLASKSLRWLATPDADIDAFALDAGRKRIVYAVNLGGRHELRRLEHDDPTPQALGDLPPGAIGNLILEPGGDGLLCIVDGAASPPALWRVDLRTGAADRVAPADERPPTARFVEPEVVHAPTFDGLEVPNFLYRPKGQPPAGGWPAVVVVHGGPEAQYTSTFRADVQHLLERGIAVLAPNVRGSTGYGRTYQALDDRELRMDSVKDLLAAGRWLRARPDVDPARIAVYGRSYGGFMVLAAMIEAPELWRCGVEFYGIAHWITLLEQTAPYRRKLRAAEYGDPVADRAMLEAFSPLPKLDRLAAPLFVAHGLCDPRVRPFETDQLEAELKRLGKPHEVIRIDQEGHGFARLDNRLEVFGRVVAFLERELGVG